MPEEPLKSRLKSSPPPSQSPFPRLSPQGTPEALPYSILRRLSSTSQSHAAPCAAWRRGVPAGLPRSAGRAGVSTARGGRRRGRWGAPGGALPRTQKVLWNSYPLRNLPAVVLLISFSAGEMGYQKK